MRDMTENEVAGFGITEPDDLLFVKEFVIVKQKVTYTSFKFEDQAVADYFDDQVDLARKPEQFSRIWLHTHPGSLSKPSSNDEDTFDRVFGNCTWAVMFILSQNGKTFARLRFNAGPGGEMDIPVSVDYSREFAAPCFALWEQQYKDNVTKDDPLREFEEKRNPRPDKGQENNTVDKDIFSNESENINVCLLDHLFEMDTVGQEDFIHEHDEQSDFWDEEDEVFYE